jgi:hypothetical protein
MVLPTAIKPAGGFQFISVAQLCAVWEAYQSHRIHLSDIRLWCAAQEMVARRCLLTPGQQPMYRQEERQTLTGRRVGGLLVLARLQQADLLTWETTAVTFPSPRIETNTALALMLKQIPNHHRRIPVPRRLLRFVAQGCPRVLLATILGHLFRCLYYRQGQCRAEGFCKASWIANVFGVSPRAVKTARQQLETLGFLQRIETPQWVRNRYGQKMTINLQWEGRAAAVAPSGASPHTLAPPPAEHNAPAAPPDSDRKLLTETKHQKPASSGSSGVLSTLFAQARECVRNGTTLVEELSPSPLPPVVLAAQPHQVTTTPVRPSSLPPPCFPHILLPDLQDIDRLLMLYTQAVQTKVIGTAEADRLTFVALAQHVVHFHPKNPGGLFLQLLKHRRFTVITQAEEDLARQRLNTFLYTRPGTTRRRIAA